MSSSTAAEMVKISRISWWFILLLEGAHISPLPCVLYNRYQNTLGTLSSMWSTFQPSAAISHLLRMMLFNFL